MKHLYDDITSRIEVPPLWWDENGTPRYGRFSPEMCPDIYADRVVLLWITCQQCGRRFDVEMHSSQMDRAQNRLPYGRDIDDFNPALLHYGDPPAHHCIGDTMNCWDIAVLESWRRDIGADPALWDWRRMVNDEQPMEDWGNTDH